MMLFPNNRSRSCRAHSCISTASSIWLSLFLIGSHLTIRTVDAFAPGPVFGLGAVLFPVRGRVVELLSEADNKRLALIEASDFFVDAFWTAKVGGGARQLTSTQKRSLQQSQTAEFTMRYGGSRRVAELLLCRNGDGEVVACAGVEVDRIPDGSLKGPLQSQAPLMSNLAVGRQYRRRGLAELLVTEVERIVQDEWGYDECYLYVEERNAGAVKLYQKLGYKKLWSDVSARTLMPTKNGDLENCPTTIVCMRKSLQESFWSRLFG